MSESDSERSVEVAYEFCAPRDAVFDLLASAYLFRLLGVNVDQGYCDPRPGGAFRYSLDDGQQISGVFVDVSRPVALSFTWNTTIAGGEVDASLVSFRFEGDEEKCQVVVTHHLLGSQAALLTHALEACASAARQRLGDALRSGLIPKFSYEAFIPAPPEQVYRAFVDSTLITQFFVSQTSGDLEVGKASIWRFAGVEREFTVYCVELEPGSLVAFNWGFSRVRIALRSDNKGGCVVTLSCQGFPPTPEGLSDSYAECEGWREVMSALASWFEKNQTATQL